MMDTLPTTSETQSILIVDDAPANLRLLSHILAGQGYTIRAVTSGPRAIEAARASPPDLILLDVMMPDLDGFTTCEQLKANPETRDIPVIFISALDATEDKIQAFTSGGVDYVTKPFHPEEVLARVQTHLSLQALQRELRAANAQLAGQVHELSALNHKLQDALDRVRTLSGLLPICANCKKVKDDQGYWHQVEVYVQEHSDAEFSHGLCPDCLRELYPEYYPQEQDGGDVE
jgi:PleD family two-component response regulator